MEKRLARGLDALLGKTQSAEVPTDRLVPHVEMIEIEKIVPNPHQPRREFKAAELEDLVSSIAENGLLQPIVVRRFGDGFQLIAGERRFRAFKQLGKTQIPALVRSTDRDQQLVFALIENLQRADLNAIEEAAAFRQLLRDFGLTHDDVAKRVGKSRTAVTNTLRLLELPEEVRSEVSRGTISAGHARSLLSLLNTPSLGEALREVKERSLSVRQTEELVRDILSREASEGSKRAGTVAKSGNGPARSADPTLQDLEEQLRAVLSAEVRIRSAGTGYEVRIACPDTATLNAVTERILSTPS